MAWTNLKPLPKDSLCGYCGRAATEWDHLVPTSKGGNDDDSNLMPCCRQCNTTKRDHLLPYAVLIPPRHLPKTYTPKDPETHIQVTIEIRDRLRAMKRGQENYDQLIRRLLDRLAE